MNDPLAVVRGLLAKFGASADGPLLEDLVTPESVAGWRRELADPEKHAIIASLGVVERPRWVSPTLAHVVLPILSPEQQETGGIVPPGGALLLAYVARVRMVDGVGWRVEHIGSDQLNPN